MNRRATGIPLRFAVLLFAACASSPPAAKVATTSWAAPLPSGPAFADPPERARKLADALSELEDLFDDQFAARKPPGMVVALVAFLAGGLSA